MGNACPTGFTAQGNGCVYDCKTSDSSFLVMLMGGQPKCAYELDKTKLFALNVLGGMPLTIRDGEYVYATLDEVKTRNPNLYTQYTSEQTRVEQELAILREKIGKDDLVKSAFQRLQDAENARDEAPDAYQKARVEYYTLVKGEGWADGEKTRIAKAEVDPIVQRYSNEYVALTGQLGNQAQAYDTMNAVKDKVFRVKDDLKYSADLLMGQVGKVQSQIALDRRKREAGVGEPGWFVWTDMALNILLVVALGAAAWFVIMKLRSPAASTPAFTEAAPPT